MIVSSNQQYQQKSTMDINRRIFLKAAAGTALSAVFPPVLSSNTFAGTAKPLREFHFSASKASVNLGAGENFVAWTYNGQIPGPEIRVKEGEVIRVVLRNFLPEGTTILEAAKQQNFRIPTLCHHDDLCVAGNCRVCVVEQLGGKALLAACATPVNEGMQILTNSLKVRAARKHVIELLLSVLVVQLELLKLFR